MQNKQNIFFLFFFLASFFVVAQTTALEEDPPKKIKERKDRIIADFNYDGWLNMPKDIKQKPYSLGGNAYLMWDYPVRYGPFSLGFGIGLSTHNVHHNGIITYSIDGKYTSIEPRTSGYKRNKLSCNYVEVPLVLRIRTGNGHKFKMAVGGKIGYLYSAHSKIIDDDGKRKIYWIKNLNPIRYGVTFRIGYDKITLQGFYALSELFEKNKGEPKMIPFSFGVGILLY